MKMENMFAKLKTVMTKLHVPEIIVMLQPKNVFTFQPNLANAQKILNAKLKKLKKTLLPNVKKLFV